MHHLPGNMSSTAWPRDSWERRMSVAIVVVKFINLRRSKIAEIISSPLLLSPTFYFKIGNAVLLHKLFLYSRGWGGGVLVRKFWFHHFWDFVCQCVTVKGAAGSFRKNKRPEGQQLERMKS